MTKQTCPACKGDGRYRQFKCPRCGGSKFGTSMRDGGNPLVPEDSTGHCHEIGCSYSWNRANDEGHFVATRYPCTPCQGTGKSDGTLTGIEF